MTGRRALREVNGRTCTRVGTRLEMSVSLSVELGTRRPRTEDNLMSRIFA